MAMGSFSEAPAAPATAPAGSASGWISAWARPLIVGFCQKSTGETGRPSNSDSSPDNTTASRDPRPSSLTGASRWTWSGLHPTFVTK